MSRATNDNSYVWSDGTTTSSTTTKQYTVYASNGIRLLGSPTEGVDGGEDNEFTTKGQMDTAIIDTFQGMPENLGVSTNYSWQPTRYLSYASPTNDYAFNFVTPSDTNKIGSVYHASVYGAHAVSWGTNVTELNTIIPTGTNKFEFVYDPISGKWEVTGRAF